MRHSLLWLPNRLRVVTVVATKGAWGVPTIGRVENKIFKVEMFRVTIRNERGRDVRSDRRNIPGYPYTRAAPERMTVAQWRDSRFKHSYVGLDAQVLFEDGRVADGRTLLSTVRDSY